MFSGFAEGTLAEQLAWREWGVIWILPLATHTNWGALVVVVNCFSWVASAFNQSRSHSSLRRTFDTSLVVAEWTSTQTARSAPFFGR